MMLNFQDNRASLNFGMSSVPRSALAVLICVVLSQACGPYKTTNYMSYVAYTCDDADSSFFLLTGVRAGIVAGFVHPVLSIWKDGRGMCTCGSYPYTRTATITLSKWPTRLAGVCADNRCDTGSVCTPIDTGYDCSKKGKHRTENKGGNLLTTSHSVCTARRSLMYQAGTPKITVLTSQNKFYIYNQKEKHFEQLPVVVKHPGAFVVDYKLCRITVGIGITMVSMNVGKPLRAVKSPMHGIIILLRFQFISGSRTKGLAFILKMKHAFGLYVTGDEGKRKARLYTWPLTIPPLDLIFDSTGQEIYTIDANLNLIRHKSKDHNIIWRGQIIKEQPVISASLVNARTVCWVTRGVESMHMFHYITKKVIIKSFKIPFRVWKLYVSKRGKIYFLDRRYHLWILSDMNRDVFSLLSKKHQLSGYIKRVYIE